MLLSWTSEKRLALLNIEAATLSDAKMSKNDFITAQSHDPACENLNNTLGLTLSKVAYDYLGFLDRMSKLNGALQRVVPTSMRAQVL